MSKTKRKERNDYMTGVVAEFLTPDGQVVKAWTEQEVRTYRAKGYTQID